MDFTTIVRAAKSGYVSMARIAVSTVADALLKNKPIDQRLRRYVGEALQQATSVACVRHVKTEEKAINVCKALGFIAERHQRPKRFQPIAKDWRITGIVLWQKLERGCPLTGETGAFAKTSNILGNRFSRGKVRSAFYRIRNLRIDGRSPLDDPDSRNALLNLGSFYAKPRRRRNTRT